MKIGIAAGRRIKPNMEVGICGEHGGDPSSIKFCHNENLSYVSASPHRIPIAIIAAAQAAIEHPKKSSSLKKPVKKIARKPVKKALPKRKTSKKPAKKSKSKRK